MNTTRVWAITGIAAAFALVGACSGGDEPGTGLRERVGERRESIVEAPANGGVVTMAGTGAPAFHDDTPLASSFNDPAGIAVGPDGAIYVADWGNNAVRRIRASDGNVETVVRGFENLIKNPRAEQTPSATPGIPQWDIVTGAWIPTSKAECATALCGYPFDGSRWFWGGNVTSAQLKQDISLANRGIAQGGQHAIFEIWMRSLTAERSRALVEYFDAQGVLKTSYDTGEHADSTWTPYVDDRILPTTVTKAKVTLFTRATSGGAADSYFDGLQLRISNGGINPILDHGFVAVSAVGVTNTGKIYVGASDGLSVFDAPANTVIATRTATLPLPHVANIATLSDGYAYAADSYHVHLWGILPGAAGFYPVNVLGGSNAEPLAVAAKVINASTHRLYVSYRRYFEVDVFDCPVGTAQGVAVTCTNANVVIGAGQGFADDMDGTAGGERLGYPHGLALGRFGEVLIADEANHSVRRSFLPLTQTSAGTGVLGFTADGPSNLARFWSPTGVAATPAGDIVVTDRMNNRVRKIVCAGSNACAATAGMNCPVLPASDNEPCTTDTCLTLGVNHVPKAAGAACDDGTVCNGSETCSAAGVCQAGTPLTVTPDTNPCTADYCDPVSGGVHVNLPNGTPCLVADPCQTAGSCSSGVCGGTQLVNINDNNDCTIDACTASGITHTGVSGNPPCGGGTGVCFAETCRDSGSGLGAPPLDGTIAASLADSFSSLTSGTNPQHVPDASKIDPKRAALIRGRVVDTSGAPLGGVTVSIADHTEYGYFGTSTSGEFFLEVNGGAPLTVRFAGPFFMLVAERRVSPEWGGTVGLYDVVLVRNDQFGPPQMVTIGSASPAAWVTGSTVSETVAGATVSHKTSMFFPAGTTTTPAMTSLQLRVVEYTLGPKGAQAMPADIATNTAYTYAAEFSVDSSIESVEFAKPVFAYVDNFMNVAAGTMVPAGYYDRAKHIWVPETNQVPTAAVPNGRVISLDASCNADAASQTYFSGLGANYAFTAAEQAKLLAAGYANKTVWRMPLLHFSPHDFNFTAQPPKCEAVGAAPGTDCADTSSASCACPDADGRVAGNDEPEGGSCEGSGSIIKLEQQILGEQLPVGGTPFTLNYRSDRVPGYLWGRTAEINFDGPKHSKLKQYKVRLAVAGQIRDQVFSPNVSGPQYFTWDGLDFAGRRIVGSQKASIEVSSVYPVSYVSGERFMDYPSGTSVGITSDARGQATEMVASKEAYRYFHNLDAAALGLGGWSLSPFHQYDPDERVLYLGDGERRTIDDSDNVVSAVAGSGISIDPGGTVATDATFGELNDMVASPSGELFIAKLSPAVVQKIGADNKITTVAGSGTSQNPPPAFVEGAVATATQLWRQDPVAPVAGSAKGIALAADGTLYIADGMSFLYRVDPAGKIWTVAGVAGVSTVADCGAANNVVAKGARLCSPTQVAVAPDGAVYVNSKNAQNRTVIKRIDPGATTANSPARITTVAGGGTTNDATHVDSNMRATQLGIAADTTFQVGPDGSLWFTSAPDIYRLHPNGRLQPYPASASTASACNFKRFYAGQDLSITPDNAVVFREFGTGWGQSGGRCEDRIYRLGSDDVLTNAVGNGVTQNNSDPPKLGALSSRVSLIYEITAVGPDGAIYFAQRANHRIYKSARPNPRQDAGCVYSIPSDDGAEFYCFNDKGRHLFTFDSKTGAKLYTFLPTTGGPVTSITDVANRVTNIAYTGTTATITSPYGQTTVITLSQGYATSIKNSLGVAASVTHNYQGLLTSFTPAGNTGAYTFGYDQLGRLTRDSDPNGGVQTFNRTPSPTDPSVTRVTRMTAQGRASSYDLTVGDSMNQSRAVTAGRQSKHEHHCHDDDQQRTGHDDHDGRPHDH